METEKKNQELKCLGFVRIATIKALVCVLSEYEYAKQNSGPLISTVGTKEGVVTAVVEFWKSDLDCSFSIIANMLRRIELLDNSIISKGVLDSAKDSMKQTISSMLRLLLSDHFSVSIRVSKYLLDRLIVSLIIAR